MESDQKSGKNDLLLACTIGDLGWLKRGLLTGVSVPETKNREDLTCLHLTAKNGHLECMEHLLENCDVEVNTPAATNGNSALHYCISSTNSSKSYPCMKLLLEKGADPNLRNSLGQTALHIASQCGNIKCLKYLLKQGCDIHATDDRGHTALKYASLHCHHECARLLQALHWAHNKEQSTSEKLQENAAVQKREQEIRQHESQLKKERAAVAYNNWLEENSLVSMKTEPPDACRQRREVRKESKASTCVSCTVIAKKKRVTPHRSKPIKVNPKQVKRNTNCIGKPAKMHQYTNSTRSSARSHSSIGSSRGTEGTSLRSSRILSGKSFMSSRHSRSASVNAGSSIKNPNHNTSEPHHFIQPLRIQEEDSIHIRNEKLEFDNDSGKLFSFGPEPTDSDEDDSLFHDVGSANSLDSLALPNVVTNGKTPVELLQLFRRLSNPSPQSYTRSMSQGKSQSFRSRQYQRRFSLGTIHEGRMMTDYNDDMSSESQFLDTNFLEELILSFSSSKADPTAQQTTPNRTSRQQTTDYDAVYCVESEDSLSSGETTSSVEEFFDDATISLSTSKTDRQDESVLPKSQVRSVSPPHSLKIVNLAWNSETNMVESRITVSPLSTPKKSTSPRNVTPSPKSPSSTKDVRFLPGMNGVLSINESDVISKPASPSSTLLEIPEHVPQSSSPNILSGTADMNVPMAVRFSHLQTNLASKSTLLHKIGPASSQCTIRKRVRSAPISPSS